MLETARQRVQKSQKSVRYVAPGTDCSPVVMKLCNARKMHKLNCSLKTFLKHNNLTHVETFKDTKDKKQWNQLDLV